MNKDYLCRAKQIQTGEWIEGYLLIWKDMAFICGEPCTCMNGHEHQKEYLGFEKFVEVNPNTICRCTGKLAEGNRVIYENDIVYDYEEEDYGIVTWDKEDLCFYAEYEGYEIQLGEYNPNHLVLEGNIFDNPERKEGEIKIYDKFEAESALQDSGSSRMTLQEFEASGGCEGCQFYQNVEVEVEKKACVFPWFDGEADEWEFSKNCDEMEVE